MDTEKQGQHRCDYARLTEGGNARSEQLNTRSAYRVANQQSLACLSGSERRRPGWFLDMKYQTCSLWINLVLLRFDEHIFALVQHRYCNTTIVAAIRNMTICHNMTALLSLPRNGLSRVLAVSTFAGGKPKCSSPHRQSSRYPLSGTPAPVTMWVCGVRRTQDSPAYTENSHP